MCLKKYRVTLTAEERLELKKVASSGKAGGKSVRRALLLMALDETEGSPQLSENELTGAFSISLTTLFNLRKRFVEEGFDAALHGRRRTTSPTPPKMTGKLEAYLVAMACSEAPQGYGRWSLRLLSGRLVELGYCESISYETIRKTLKKTILNLGKLNTI